jgi:hypothetical protein
MKVTIIHNKSGVKKNEYRLYDRFIKYLQEEFPLKHDLTITFLGERLGKMTTGSRFSHDIKILSKNRMNRDILRTLAHEWVHEYQMDILNRDMGPDIGGKNEDEANSESGAIMKKFERDFPDSESDLYN